MQVFGSDGFRCKFGEKYMTPDFIYEFTNSLAEYCITIGSGQPILIARDTRSSGIIVEDFISAILQYKGLNVVLCGILPTPGLSTVLASGNFSIGIMITASHNPHFDNGIKLFGSDGFKLKESDEAEIERKILNPSKMSFIEGSDFVGKTFVDGQRIYGSSVIEKFVIKELEDSILVDCSNGACSNVVKENLKKFSNINFINDTPNGRNINLDCGALEAKKLLSKVISENYDYGVAFDGDGDRSIFVSRDYGIIESEKLLYLFYKLLKASKASKDSNIVVATEICNLALKHNLDNIGAVLTETPVGDRFVTEEVRKLNAVLGAEPSGHFYFPTASKSMDGFLGLCHFLKLLEASGSNLTLELSELKHYDRIEKNINIQENNDLDLDSVKEKVLSQINPLEEKLIIRKSMWDPVLRIYYDYVKENRFNNIEKVINDCLT